MSNKPFPFTVCADCCGEVETTKKAECDAQGNVIHETYATKKEVENGIEDVKKDTNKLAEQVANAIKGTATGEVIRIDDVSPIAHTSTVKLTSDTLTDFSGVTLSKYGKNLWDFGKNTLFKKQEDGSYANNALTDTRVTNVNLPIGNYHISFSLSDLNNYNHRIVFTLIDSEGKTTSVMAYSTLAVKGKGIVSYKLDYGTRAPKGGVIIRRPQIEAGDTRTDYEEYKAPETYTPNADGTVEGVELNAPTTTLFTDTEGVNIEVNYNQDTKSYIDKKFAELQALILEG